MIRNTCGLILADDKRIHMGDLTRPRALSAVPFGGRYRIIDFALSNMVNSGILTIAVSTFNKYKSLMDHLGTGSAWDLDRKSQGLYILPPYISSESYTGRGDDLSGIISFFREIKQEYIIVSSASCILNTTYDELMAYHRDKNADISVMYNRDGYKAEAPVTILDMTRSGRVKGVYENPLNPVSNRNSLGVMLMRRELFVEILGEAMSRGTTEVNPEFYVKEFDRYAIYGYEYKGCALRINSTQAYFDATLRALSEPTRTDVFWQKQPVFTKVKDEAPAIYSEDCEVRDSMISDGCYIQGSVKHSMLFRNVSVGNKAKLTNCIIFQDTQIADGCELENVIIDKKCVIRPGIKLIGQAAYPVVIGKGAIV
ncbi:glucose-1-phosphate adenylyltransferase subunit GlgD [Oscillospiraceae bacterium HV4-5-C5C]|nr:glucose-1-phosphate adenylyltransferase subunit GlgD [Oscillospiraceae bacterium HV4-5-C5C]